MAILKASFAWCAAVLLSTAFQAGGKFPTTGPTDPIVAPPPELRQGGFYKKCAYFHGLPIIGSAKVSNKAFHRLVYILGKVLQKLPSVEIEYLVKAGSHYSIIGATEGQTDLPEYADLRNDPHMDWNKRARGLGGRITSAGEENILELPSDRYKGESICIHEFSHTLAQVVFRHFDPTFRSTLVSDYKQAMSSGLWKDTYSTTDPDEYWAEGVQMYFDCARRSVPPNGVHNAICNRVGLKKYDVRLYDLVNKEFHHNPWRYDGSYNTTKISD